MKYYYSCKIKYCKVVAEKHLRLSIVDSTRIKLDSILFNAFDSNLGNILMNNKDKVFHFVGKLEINDWGGQKRPSLQIIDAARLR